MWLKKTEQDFALLAFLCGTPILPLFFQVLETCNENKTDNVTIDNLNLCNIKRDR